MDPLDNPFRPGAGTQPPALLGRDDLIDEFGVELRRTLGGRPGKGILLTGLRGVGKTVLLRRFHAIARDERVFVLDIEASEEQRFTRALVVRLRALLLDLQSTGPSRAVARALAILRSFTLTLPDGMSIHLDVAPIPGQADTGLIDEDLPTLLQAVAEAAQDRGTGVMISVDEIQYLADDEFAALIASYHRTCQHDLPMLLVGAGLPQLPSLAGVAKSYAERLFRFPTIGALDRNSVAPDAIRIPLHDVGVTIDDEAVAAIATATQGYPYFLQEWGYSTWNAAGTTPITASDVTIGQAEALARLDDNFFRVRYERLTDAEREYLHSMARLGPGPHRSGDISQELGVRVESVAPRRSNLIRKGMIYSPAHGSTAFSVPLFDEFLTRVGR